MALIILAQKYDYNKRGKSKGIETWIVVIIIVISALGVSILFIYGSREPKVEIIEDKIVISGIYGTVIQRD